MAGDAVLIERRGAVALVTFNRPERLNAWSPDLGAPQVSLGILPAYGGTLRLARFVGRGNALHMALTGRKVGAEEALRMADRAARHEAWRKRR